MKEWIIGHIPGAEKGAFIEGCYLHEIEISQQETNHHYQLITCEHSAIYDGFAWELSIYKPFVLHWSCHTSWSIPPPRSPHSNRDCGLCTVEFHHYSPTNQYLWSTTVVTTTSRASDVYHFNFCAYRFAVDWCILYARVQDFRLLYFNWQPWFNTIQQTSNNSVELTMLRYTSP